MIYVLKIILALVAVAMSFAINFIYKDFIKVRETEGFDDLTVWQKIKFSFTFFSMLTSVGALIIFLIYFIFVKITLY